MLFHKTYDSSLMSALYVHLKIGQFFDVYIDGKIIQLVGEKESLNNYQNGRVEFVMMEGKQRKRKSGLGYWRQASNNDCKFETKNEIIGVSKRTFSFQGEKKEGRKLFEYFLYWNLNQNKNSPKGYKVLLRHYLSDNPKNENDSLLFKRLNPISTVVSIKSKSNPSDFYYLNEIDYKFYIENLSDYLYQFNFWNILIEKKLIYNLEESSVYTLNNKYQDISIIDEEEIETNRLSQQTNYIVIN